MVVREREDVESTTVARIKDGLNVQTALLTAFLYEKQVLHPLISNKCDRTQFLCL